MSWVSALSVDLDLLLASKTTYVWTISLLIPLALALLFLRQNLWSSSKQVVSGDGPGATAAGGCKGQDQAQTRGPTKLSEEPWCPKLDTQAWERAADLQDCPWDFQGCKTLEEAMTRIWQQPLPEELKSAFDCLLSKVQNLQIARMTVASPREDVRFSAIYTLSSGAELFGGGPAQVGDSLPACPGAEASCEDKPGLRPALTRSTDSGRPASAQTGLSPFTLPSSLHPFYRVHDGFGMLLSTRHLPFLLCHPGDAFNGSCFYIYPVRALEIVPQLPHLFRFARVDRTCIACARRQEGETKVAYVENTMDVVEEDEAPLTFIADTISNISGQRVVPPTYLGGPGAFGYTACEGWGT